MHKTHSFTYIHTYIHTYTEGRPGRPAPDDDATDTDNGHDTAYQKFHLNHLQQDAQQRASFSRYPLLEQPPQLAESAPFGRTGSHVSIMVNPLDKHASNAEQRGQQPLGVVMEAMEDSADPSQDGRNNGGQNGQNLAGDPALDAWIGLHLDTEVCMCVCVLCVCMCVCIFWVCMCVCILWVCMCVRVNVRV
jgi:hypothetical protein